MLEEMTLNLFEAMPHAAFNIVDFAKGIGANFTANIGSALLNTVLQIVFFIGVLFVIPWIVGIVVEKFSDVNYLATARDKAFEDGNIKKASRLQIILYFMAKMFTGPAIVIQSWTSDLITRLIEIPILLLSFNHPCDFECYVDTNDDEGETIKGELNFGYQLYDPSEVYWKNPWKQLGVYIVWAIQMIVPLVFPIAVLYFLLPNTFTSVVAGLGQWATFQSGTPNLTFFTNMALMFKDIAWDRMILGAIRENILFFALFVVALYIYTDHCISLIVQVPMTDKNDIPTGDVKVKLYDPVYAWPMTAIIILLVNLILATFLGSAYSTISYQVNSAGMVLFFVILVKEMAKIVLWCFKRSISFIINLKG
jgi:hypothetical protein